MVKLRIILKAWGYDPGFGWESSGLLKKFAYMTQILDGKALDYCKSLGIQPRFWMLMLWITQKISDMAQIFDGKAPDYS